MNKPAFELKPPAQKKGLFMPTDTASSGTGEINISADKLVHYSKHPFKLYQGERYWDMVESISANGILVSLIVRPQSDDYYEILSGHNRFECGKEAGLTEMPCIIKVGLSDEEAHIIVTESNLLQRSFTDLSHSERAEALATHYEAIKHQGKRTDLIKQVEAMLNGENAVDSTDNPEGSTNTPVGNKSIDVTGEKYGLSKNSVARYIRVNSLIPGFKELLDSEELSIRAGVSLSYISGERQQVVLEQMQRYDANLSMKQAEELRRLDSETKDTSDQFMLGCADILQGREVKDASVKKTIKLKFNRAEISSYFSDEDTEEVIQETVLEALQFYHQFRGKYQES